MPSSKMSSLVASTTTKRVICIPLNKSAFRHALAAKDTTPAPDLMTFSSIGMPIHKSNDDDFALSTTRKTTSKSAKRSQQKSPRNNNNSIKSEATSATNSTTTTGCGSQTRPNGRQQQKQRVRHHKNQRLCAKSIPSLLSSSTSYYGDCFSNCCTSCSSKTKFLGNNNAHFAGCNYLYRSDFAQHVRYENGCFTMQERIYLPDNPRFKIIGRILGPRGYSLRQLEAETGCRIVIRGKGSVKDENKEARLRGLPGWEHLNEPLHVLLNAHHQNHLVCSQKLHYAVHCMRGLLTPRFDAYKREQLLQLSIINGTYQPRT